MIKKELYDVAAHSISDQVAIKATLEEGYEPFSVVMMPVVPTQSKIKLAEDKPTFDTIMWFKRKVTSEE